MYYYSKPIYQCHPIYRHLCLDGSTATNPFLNPILIQSQKGISRAIEQNILHAIVQIKLSVLFVPHYDL